jgi:Zn-dependent alcohol dehydrogenase
MEITAAVAVHPYTDFEFDKLQLADPRPDEVLVEVEAVGLCHTDIGARDGALPIELPAVLGHEGSGTVVSVGVDVTKVAPGDRVVMSFNSCGDCTACVEGVVTVRQCYPAGPRQSGGTSSASHRLPPTHWCGHATSSKSARIHQVRSWRRWVVGFKQAQVQ